MKFTKKMAALFFATVLCLSMALPAFAGGRKAGSGGTRKITETVLQTDGSKLTASGIILRITATLIQAGLIYLKRFGA